eukprot:5927046-Ditylum_brightwellii.AAC.1
MEADNNGRLPLHHFLDNTRVEGKWATFRSIVKAGLDAIFVQDPVTGLHSALLAAANNKNDLVTI